MLLTLGGVPRSFFTKLVDKAIENVGIIVNDPKAAWNGMMLFPLAVLLVM